ncbi:MAG: hypothetical protein MPI95_02025 [Nitrosopumilus sp.]|nr:hypothetical protein [Nitrosopumilus sp.]MDA7942385.1 hypothetical protein [Nitrosopumilus sp.]MDA7957858.1 hypothetical protein [Nitrosopumilus sp.]MDA7960549.1 hypothetical protein [Nitrosopumilus sp.]
MVACRHRFRRDGMPEGRPVRGVYEMESPEVRVYRFRCTRPDCNTRKVVRRSQPGWQDKERIIPLQVTPP